MIEGRVAAIVDDSSVVINVGKTQGVKPGMRFLAVYKTDRIVDPEDPSNSLDGLTLIIGELEAASVLERFTFCTVNNPVKSKAFSTLFVTETASLIADDQRQLAGEDARKIRVGTHVQEAPPKPATQSKQAGTSGSPAALPDK